MSATSGTVIAALMEMLSGFHDLLGGLQRSFKKACARADGVDRALAALEERVTALEYPEYGWRPPPPTVESLRPEGASKEAYVAVEM